MLDPIDFAAKIIRCPSVTPEHAGAFDILQDTLKALGFVCTRLPFTEKNTARVDNLYARLGTAQPNFCFAGHIDVVPAGDENAWTRGAFSGEVQNGELWGRGAVDMKGAIAAFISATSRYLQANKTPPGSISLLITGDEEGPAINGTRKVLDWMRAHNQIIDDCLVGEPTNPEALGDMIKIGRRGSVSGHLRVEGVQGHVAYPDLADNPHPLFLHLMNTIANVKLDEGTPHFQPSNLEITALYVDNKVGNIIPAYADGYFNIRHNDMWDKDKIDLYLRAALDEAAQNNASAKAKKRYTLALSHMGDCFLTTPGNLVDILQQSISAVTKRVATLSTSGGTSDARFIKDYARVVEFGLVGKTMHKIDERVGLKDIEDLTDIYTKTLTAYFGQT